MSRESRTGSRLASTWPHLRAVLVILHVIAILLAAMPAPEGGMSRRAWKEPTVQGEIAAWASRLGAVGYRRSPAELEDQLWALATRWMGARRTVLKPFRPYYKHLGTEQSWRMFVAPHRHPSYLEVAIDEGEGVHSDAGWRVVYSQRGPSEGWLRKQLEQDRMRSATFRYSWPQYKGSWRALGRWMAKEAARDFPSARRIRLRWYRLRSPSPEQVRSGQEPEGRFQDPLIIDLEEPR